MVGCGLLYKRRITCRGAWRGEGLGQAVVGEILMEEWHRPLGEDEAVIREQGTPVGAP